MCTEFRGAKAPRQQAPSSERVAGLFVRLVPAYLPLMASWTIQELINDGMYVTAYCENPQCRHNAELDLEALRDRLGPDHPAMRWDILPKLVCSKCGGRNLDLKCAPDPAKVKGMGR